MTWYINDNNPPSSPHFQGAIYDEKTGKTIAITYNDEGGHNARLIAAAPEMLNALQPFADLSLIQFSASGMQSITDSGMHKLPEEWAHLIPAIRTARAVIQKATAP